MQFQKFLTKAWHPLWSFTSEYKNSFVGLLEGVDTWTKLNPEPLRHLMSHQNVQIGTANN